MSQNKNSDIKIKTISEKEKNRKQKVLTIALLFFICLIAGFSILGPKPEIIPEKEKEFIDIEPTDTSKLRNEVLEKKLLLIKNEMEKMRQEQKTLQETINSQNKEMESLKDDLRKKPVANYTLPPISTDNKAVTKKKIVNTNTTRKGIVKPPSFDQLYGSKPFEREGEASNSNIKKYKTPPIIKSKKKSNDLIIIKSGNKNTSSKKEDEGIVAEESYIENKYAGFIVKGAFIDVRLLHGVDAGVSEYTRENPQPVLVRMQSNAILPGFGSFKVESCFANGIAYGELSSERVYIRTTSISCVDPLKNLVLESKLEGYIVDSDSILGLRGKVERRSGALMGKAILAGFAQGISQIAGASQQEMTTAIGGTTSVIPPENIPEAGLWGGAANTSKILADMYIKEAKSIFPVITVKGGRQGTLVVQKGQRLEWHSVDMNYIKEYKPEGVQ